MTSPDTAPLEQKIFRFRREYNTWVADETMEDYALRYTPRSFRKWSEWRIGNTAFGSLSFLALEAIGGAIVLNYGFSNAMLAILVVGLVIYLTSLPIAYYAARYGVDMDLLTRGAGFGYLGSTLTSLIYAVFTFIFFAIEAAIMAMALQMATDWSLKLCYVLSALVVLPLALRGITFISRLQLWTQALWLFLMVLPFAWIAIHEPHLYREFLSLSGLRSGSSQFDWLMFGSASAVIFSLVVQIGEQVDFLRFLPERTPSNHWRWWGAVLVSGPGWIGMGMLKMAGGAFLAFVAMQVEVLPRHATEPTQMYLIGFSSVFGPGAVALIVTVVFVAVSQIKINVTNAYAGSLAWSNFFSRVTRSHPGRVVWLVFNIVIATLLMVLDVFAGLEVVLGMYSNVAIAWVGALVADLVINKPLGWSPKGIEFRRAHLYDFNPVGLGAMGLAATAATIAYTGVLGKAVAAASPFLALGLALLLAPLLAWATKGRYYLARPPEQRWLPGQALRCAVCQNMFESEDMSHCPVYAAPICSLCCSLESRCHDRCKTESRAADQLRHWLRWILPRRWSQSVNFRVGHFLLVFALMSGILGFFLGLVYLQSNYPTPVPDLGNQLLKVYALLLLLGTVGAWWVVLTTESRRIALDESERQSELLSQEVEAHQRTDAELQRAKDLADRANQAKTRYIAGLTHELRTPLTSILGYSQILLKRNDLFPHLRHTVEAMQRSGQHMHALIDESLELARIEAGRLRLDQTALSLDSLLVDIEQMVRPQATAKGLAFQVERIGNVPQWVRADSQRLRQILINLLANAVRFTQHGRVELRINFRQQVARFDITDTGLGIKPEDQQRIFLPFERGAAGRISPETGTGLGLTITHLLVSLMGGDLSLESTPGQGTTFTVRLYLPPVQPTSADKPTLAPLRRPATGYTQDRKTLLVVDDQPLHRHLLIGLLVPLGFSVLEAASGEECIETVQRHQPDAVLLDISMDAMDGWQTLAQLRQHWDAKTLPVVFVSANQFDQQPDRLALAQAQGFIGKPVIESDLLGVLGRVLRLEWIYEQLPSADDGSDGVPPAPPALSLPLAVQRRLLNLARLGQVHALRQCLQQAQTEHPDQHLALADLLQSVDRFDFAYLVTCLRSNSPLQDNDSDE